MKNKPHRIQIYDGVIYIYLYQSSASAMPPKSEPNAPAVFEPAEAGAEA